jgi:hypothetical protein
MKDNIKMGLKGRITITDQKNVALFDDNNQIEPSALEIITRCLTQRDFSKSINKIKAYGDFGESEANISHTEYLPGESAILLRAVFLETDFNGTVTDLELRCSALDLIFASKHDLNITKDGSARVQVDWKIFVTIN